MIFIYLTKKLGILNFEVFNNLNQKYDKHQYRRLPQSNLRD